MPSGRRGQDHGYLRDTRPEQDGLRSTTDGGNQDKTSASVDDAPPPTDPPQAWNSGDLMITTTSVLFFSPKVIAQKNRRRVTQQEGEEELKENRLCLYLLACESIWLFLYKKTLLSWKVSIYCFHLEPGCCGKVAADSLTLACEGQMNEGDDSDVI